MRLGLITLLICANLNQKKDKSVIYKSANEKRKSDLAKVERRAKLVATALEEVRDNKFCFGSKKRLILYVARFIDKSQAVELDRAVVASGVAIDCKIPHVTANGIYKSKTYSALINNWLEHNKWCVKKMRGKNDGGVSELRLQNVSLSNECARLKVEVYELQQQLIEYESAYISVPKAASAEELENSYLVIDSFISEFSDFIKIDFDGVVLDNALRRRIVNMNSFKGYLAWKGKVIQGIQG